MSTQTTTAFEMTIGGDINGTYLNGYLTASYKDICKILGKPDKGDGYKVDAQWICTINGKVLSVYNYKDGINYLGKKEGTAKTKITNWHVGGNGDIAAELSHLASLINAPYGITS